jgi:hypothetical protein
MTDGGAFWFGAVVGWLTYFTMRHKKEHAITDIATVIGALGGAAVLTLFPQKDGLFSSYAGGLATGFFGYFVVALLLVLTSKDKRAAIREFVFGKDGASIMEG